MAYGLRERFCGECGMRLFGRLPPVKEVLCIDCAVTRVAANARDIANNSGAGYDRWQKGMLAWADRLGGDTRR